MTLQKMQTQKINISSIVSIKRFFFRKTPDLLHEIDQLDFRDETILIKGARPFAFETIALRLLPYTHRTLLEINLSAIAHNIRTFNDQISGNGITKQARGWEGIYFFL